MNNNDKLKEPLVELTQAVRRYLLTQEMDELAETEEQLMGVAITKGIALGTMEIALYNAEKELAS